MLCPRNRIMVASSPLEAVCFPAIGFFSHIYSTRCVFFPGEQAVKPIRKQLATSVKLVPLSHPWAHCARLVHSWLRLLVTFYPQQLKHIPVQ